MKSTIVGVMRESMSGERRVSVVPDSVSRLKDRGFDVLVETGAGTAARFSDEEYIAAGADIAPANELVNRAGVVTCVGLPDASRLDGLEAGSILIGMLEPLTQPQRMRELADSGITAVSLDTLPRQLSRAQPMDALSSQASIAGYRAAIVAADSYEKYFPMLTTAAGTSSPATVLVLGTGVAGLSAIGTARRLGAVVSAYDVRPAARAEAESLGARFLQLESVAQAAGDGGYARALNTEEREAQQRELAEHIGRFNVVITTARVPGRKPPVLVTDKALAGMAPGSVVVDMGASQLGGNVEGSAPDATTEPVDGVRVIGAPNLAADMAPAASVAYARNLTALLGHVLPEPEAAIDIGDEIAAGVTITHDNEILNSTVAQSLDETVVVGGGAA